jgi:hypothetical protein
MRRLARVLVVMSLLCGLEVPTVALQSYAWATMLLRGLRAGPAATALAETFDGRHPCAICARVPRPGASQSLRAAPSPLKPDFFPPRRIPALAADARGNAKSRVFIAALSRSSPPPVPPPNARAA